MMLDEDEFAPSPTGEEHFDEGLPPGSGRFGGNTRQPNIKIVDKTFFNGKLRPTQHFGVHLCESVWKLSGY